MALEELRRKLGEIERREAAAVEPMGARLAELEARGEELARTRAELRRRIRAAGGDDAEALALLKGEPDAELDVAKLSAELAAVTREMHTVRRAMEIQSGQISDRPNLDKAQVAAAVPAHRETVRRVAEGAVRLSALLREEAGIRDLISPGGAQHNLLRPMCPPGLARGSFDSTQQQSGVCAFVRECVQYGFLSGSEPWLEGVNWRLS